MLGIIYNMTLKLLKLEIHFSQKNSPDNDMDGQIREMSFIQHYKANIIGINGS